MISLTETIRLLSVSNCNHLKFRLFVSYGQFKIKTTVDIGLTTQSDKRVITKVE